MGLLSFLLLCVDLVSSVLCRVVVYSVVCGGWFLQVYVELVSPVVYGVKLFSGVWTYYFVVCGADFFSAVWSCSFFDSVWNEVSSRALCFGTALVLINFFDL